MLFFSRDWTILGSKDELAEDLARIAGIVPHYLRNPDDVKQASTAMRMSWAAHRKTTRVEDVAYCLLGLFGVHMLGGMRAVTGYASVMEAAPKRPTERETKRILSRKAIR